MCVGFGILIVAGFCGNQVASLLPGEVPIGTVIILGGIANGIVGNFFPVELNEKVLPHVIFSAIAIQIVVAILIGMDCGPIGGSEDIARAVIGVGVGLTAAGLLGQLVLGIVGIGVGSAVFRIGGYVTQFVIGIAVGIERIPVGILILVGADLPGGLCGANVPISVVAVQQVRIHLAHPLQCIVGKSKAAKGGCALFEGHIGEAACGFTVGEGLSVGGAAYGPLLGSELVVGVVDLPGLQQLISTAVPYGAGIQPPQGIVIIGVGIAGLTVGDAVELPIAGVGVGQDPPIGIGGSLGPS